MWKLIINKSGLRLSGITHHMQNVHVALYNEIPYRTFTNKGYNSMKYNT